jgi:hypothetical protein
VLCWRAALPPCSTLRSKVPAPFRFAAEFSHLHQRAAAQPPADPIGRHRCRYGSALVARCYWDFGRWSDLWRAWRPLPDSGASLEECLLRIRTQEASRCPPARPAPPLACLPCSSAVSLRCRLSIGCGTVAGRRALARRSPISTTPPPSPLPPPPPPPFPTAPSFHPPTHPLATRRTPRAGPACCASCCERCGPAPSAAPGSPTWSWWPSCRWAGGGWLLSLLLVAVRAGVGVGVWLGAILFTFVVRGGGWGEERKGNGMP